MAVVIVLDASVLIAYVDGSDALHGRAEQLLEAIINEDLGANTLTLAEVLVAPTRADRLDAMRKVLTDLEIDELPFPTRAAERLAELRVATGLKMPDCCVLLAAEDRGGTLASFDDQLVRAASERHLSVVRR